MGDQNKRLGIILFAVAFLLLLPFIVMQFTNQVVWTLFDFLAWGILLLAIGIVIEIGLRKVTGTKKRIVLLITILAIFLLVWAELAVGIFGTPLAGN